MAFRPDFFTKELYLAWLLRGDVRQTLGQYGDEAAARLFVGWWLIHGRNDYPAAPPLGPEQLAVATSPSGLLEHGEEDVLPISYLMHYVWMAREDLQQSFDLTAAAGRNGLAGWYYLYGLHEHSLPLPAAEAESLGAPVLPTAAEGLPFRLTRLAYLAWQARDDLKAALPDLRNPVQQLSFIAWFYLQGTVEHHLDPLLRPWERTALREPIHPSERHRHRIAGWLLLAWLIDTELRSSFNIHQAADCDKLAQWGEQAGLRRFPIETLLQPAPSPGATAAPPPPGRETAARPGRRRAAAAVAQPSPAPSMGVNLVGYATGELGIGEDVRMMVKSLLTTDIPFCVINRKPSSTIRQGDDSILSHVAEQPLYPVTIICMTGFDTVQLALERPDVFDGRYVIGYWPWELPEWPEEWKIAYDLVDEIWASSRFTESAYRASSPKPVQYMPMTVSFDDPGPFRKSDFGLPADHFLFLFAFDFMSYPARKNPEGCISAFRQAFPEGSEKAALVLKVSNVVAGDARWNRLKKLCRQDRRIVVIDETLDRRRVLGLMSVCDAYVSLHRAEGFGRTLAEAMLLNKPVIGTGFSGNVDYLSDDTGFVVPYKLRRVRKSEYPFAEGMSWADPDLAAAAAHFREVFEGVGYTDSRVRRGCQLISTVYAACNTAKHYRTRIRELAPICVSNCQIIENAPAPVYR